MDGTDGKNDEIEKLKQKALVFSTGHTTLYAISLTLFLTIFVLGG
jgi:hypothetical protein